MSNHDLIEKLHASVRCERGTTAGVLLLLIEVDNRKLHLDRYSSLFAYCTDCLGYSRSSAGRRLIAARCLRSHPQALSLLLDGRLNLTTLCILARVLNASNARDLFTRAAGATEDEVERMVAELGSPRPKRDRIRVARAGVRPPRVGAQPAAQNTSIASAAADESETAAEMSNDGPSGAAKVAGVARSLGGEGLSGVANRSDVATLRGVGATSDVASLSGAGNTSDVASLSGAGNTSDAASLSGAGNTSDVASLSGAGNTSDVASLSGIGNASDTPGGEKPQSDEQSTATALYDVSFRASDDFVAKLRRAQDLVSKGGAAPSLETVLSLALEALLERRDPRRREARRAARSATRNAGGSRRASQRRLRGSRTAGARQRHSIPARTRDRVLVRDGQRCTFVGPEGRCPETRRLEVDHRVPIAQGGSNDESNLRTLCAGHNQRAADRALGADFMASRRRSKPPRGVDDRRTTPRTRAPIQP